MAYPESEPARTAIPEGTVVTCRVRRGARYVKRAGTELKIAYRIEMDVLDGPYAGAKVYRTMWDSANGRQSMRRDLAEFGIDDPDELCRTLASEYVVRARITPTTDPAGEPCDGVQWFKLISSTPLLAPGGSGSAGAPSENPGNLSLPSARAANATHSDAEVKRGELRF